MKLISKLTTALNRWRQRVQEIQYKDGRQWAYSAYYNGAWSLEEVEIQSHPFGGGSRNPFELGIMDAVAEIQRELAAKRMELNEVGEPVGVPFFVEMVPGHKDRTYTVEEMLDEFKQKKGELRRGL